MIHSRRNFLAAASASLAAAPFTTQTANAIDLTPGLSEKILRRFRQLPGDTAIKILAPGKDGRNQLSIELNSSRQLFVASSIKTFVLCEALRQIDSPDIVERLETSILQLNDSVWSPGSPTFNPPNLTGEVSERTTLDAMINHSDNTATDMIFRLVGANNVRHFIAEIGLKSTLVPNSTRALAAYIFGAPNYLTITWEELQKLSGPPVHPFLNKVETLASSASDLVSYYFRALTGQFFKHAETLQEYRRILSLCDFIYLVPLPLGVSSYAKSGNADGPGFHARSIAGGIYFAGQWVFFAFLINWYAEEAEDPRTVQAYFDAINESLTEIRDRFSNQSEGFFNL
jgi:beta-lactamase class A